MVDEGVTWAHVYRIPAFNVDSDDARRMNQAIYDRLKPCVDEALEMLQSGGSPVTSSINYEVYQNGSIVSVVVLVHPDWPQPTYFVMNLDTSTGREVSRAELLAGKGFTEESFLAAARRAFMPLLEERWADYGSEEYAEQKQRAYAETTSDANFDNRLKLFYNAYGTLCMITDIYQPAGADRTETVIAVNP